LTTISFALHQASELLDGVTCDLTARVEVTKHLYKLTVDLYRSFDTVSGQSPYLDTLLSRLEDCHEIDVPKAFVLPIVKYEGRYAGMTVQVNARRAVAA
jgi:hypothetical protein